MATQFEIDCALMAGASYISTRSDINQFPAPLGWTERIELRARDDSSGFEAATFQRGTEIVISFAGTNPNNVFDPDNGANVNLATGFGSEQLLQAAEYYLQVKAANSPGTTITLTGHSLGGGLAALIGVFFGVQASTFDQAPFANSAKDTSNVATDLKNYLAAKLNANGNRLYDDAALSGLTNFLQLRAANGGIPNSGLVSTIRVDGEFTSSLPVGLYDPIGTSATVLDHGPNFSPSLNMHSQSLLTAFLQSDQSAAGGSNPQQTLSEVTKKLTGLLGMIFNGDLYSFDTNKEKVNLLEHLVRHEAGMQGSFAADAMVTRFTSDLWKLAQDGGLTMADGNEALNEVSKTLMAFAMQKYYEEQLAAGATPTELFTDLTTAGVGSNGIRFDMADVSKTFATAFNDNDKLKLTDAKGFDLYFKNYLGQRNVFTAAEQQLIQSMLPYMRDWYVQAGASGMNATDTLNRGAFMLGGMGQDTLTGGSGADLLVGNGGNDALNGGQGMDTLLGGNGDDTLNGNEGSDFLYGGGGADTYEFSGNYGLDIVIDSDGGSLKMDGHPALTGGAKIADNVWESDDKQYLYTLLEGNLIVSQRTPAGTGGLIAVQGWQNMVGSNFGISLNAAANPATPASTLTGDFIKKTNADGTQYLIGDDGNYQSDGDAPGAADLITGTDAADWIRGLGGDDALLGRGGDDLIEGGEDNDILQGGLGRDTLNGGAGRDLIYGSSNGSLYYPTNTDYKPPQSTYPKVIGQGFSWVHDSKGLDADGFDDSYLSDNVGRDQQPDDQGNLIDGGAGNDYIYAGTGSDVVHGGEDNDDVIGMAGNDILFGDGGRDRIYGDGPNDATLVVFTPPEQHGYDVIFGGAGDDLLFGQGKDDILYGGADNDVLYGDDIDPNNTPPDAYGNDYLDGGTGMDKLYGGNGDDILIGGAGADTLEGGAGKDIYIFNRGDSGDTIIDTLADHNILRFGAGISGSDVTLRLGSLMLDLGNGDEVHIKNFNQNDVFHSASIDSFEFADGTVLTTNELLARGFDLDGIDLDDTIVGTNTTDRINGFGGNDTLCGEDGNDIVHGGDGDDELQGDNPTHSAQFHGDDVLDGGAGNDILFGDGGNDFLDGGSGSDAMLGGDGNDTLIGGGEGVQDANGIFSGGDWLEGGAGDDTYIAGSGDYIVDSQGNNVLVMADGLSAGSIVMMEAGGGASPLAIQVGEGQYVFIQDGLTKNTITNYKFADGTQIEHSELVGNTLITAVNLTADNGVAYGGRQDDYLSAVAGIDATLSGGRGNDSLSGDTGDDILDGGSGNDMLAGNDGNDTYRFKAGFGRDIINNNDSDGANATDKIVFGAGITAQQISFNRDWQDLVIDAGGADSIRVWNYFGGATRQIDQIAFDDGTVWDAATIAAKAQPATAGDDVMYGIAGNDLLSGAGGNDQLFGRDGDDTLYGEDGVDVLDGEGGNDVLAGGAGNDVLRGGAGNDTYLFSAGDGKDVVIDSEGANQIAFGAGLNLASLAVSQGFGEDGKLYLDFDFGNGDRLSIERGDQRNVQSFSFDDGTVLTIDDMFQRVPGLLMIGTLQDDQITGTPGDDEIYGDDGDDVLQGGAGRDYLNGGNGNDTLIGGDGDDELVGGVGDDLLNGGAGSDAYDIGLGMGYDTIIEQSGGTNELRLASNISAADLSYRRDGNDLIVQLLDGAESARLKNYFSGIAPTWQVRGADGAVVALDTFFPGLSTGQPSGLAGGSPAEPPPEPPVGPLDETASIVDAIAVFKRALAAAVTGPYYEQGYEPGPDGNYQISSWNAEAQSDGTISNSVTGDSRSQAFSSLTDNAAVINLNAHSDAVTTITVTESTRYVRSAGREWRAPATFRGGSSGSPPPFIPSDGMPSGGGGSVQLPQGYMPLYFTDADNHITGIAIVPPPINGTPIADQPQLDQAQLVTERTETRTTNTTDYFPELQAGDAHNVIFIDGGGIVDAGAGNDTILATQYIAQPYQKGPGAFLYGNDGYDRLIGSSFNDVLIGGRDFDYMDGSMGADIYRILNEDNVDTIEDTGNDYERYKTWYYHSIGIKNVAESEEFGGKWKLWLFGSDNNGHNGYYDSYEEAVAAAPWWVGGVSLGNGVTHIPPLPELPFIAGNDYAALAPLYAAGAIQIDTVVFGDGVALNNLQVTGDVASGYMSLRKLDGTGVDITLATAEDAIGTGIELVKFADGMQMTIGEMVARINANQHITGSNGQDTIVLGSGNDTLDAGTGNDYLEGGAGNDILHGGEGDDDLEDWEGSNVLDGGDGDDYLYGDDGANFMVGGKGADYLDSWGAHSVIGFNAGDGADIIYVGNTLTLSLGGGISADSLSLSVDDYGLVLNIGTGDASQLVPSGDSIRLTSYDPANRPAMTLQIISSDIRTYDFNAVIATFEAAVAQGAPNTGWPLASALTSSVLTVISPDQVIGGEAAYRYARDGSLAALAPDAIRTALSDVDFGAAAQLVVTDSVQPVISGTQGNDIVQGSMSNDTLNDSSGNNLFHANAGDDAMAGGVGNELYIGGAGNDLIDTGTGADVIAFNRGNGQDTVVASAGKDNTLSLGAGIQYADLLFRKTDNDLILVTGTDEKVMFKDWYADINNHSVANLQMVIEGTTDYDAASANPLNNKKVEQFNFDGLVTAFDQAQAADPALSSWALSSALLDFYLGSSDTAAMGGDLAYQYAKNGNLSSMSMTPAQALLASTQFGTANQNLQAAAALKDLSPSLM